MADRIAPPLASLAVPIDSLTPHPRNARQGDVGALSVMLDANTQYKPVVVQRSTGFILAGNHLWRAAKTLGWTEIAATILDVTDAEATRILVADNRASDLATYAQADLAVLLQELDQPNRQVAGWDDEDLNTLLADLVRDAARANPADPDAVPETPAEPYVKTGDLWVLGDHRLLCGDATKAEDVARLMDGTRVDVILTDPPYGIAVDTDFTRRPRSPGRGLLRDYPAKTYRTVEGDNRAFQPGPVLAAVGPVAEAFWFGADYYRRALSDDDRGGSWLVWDKRSEETDAGIGSGFELIWSQTRHKRLVLRHFFYGAFGAEASGRVHPTQKPTTLFSDILERWAPPSAVVWDGFVGSGTTIIAAEREARRCYAMEIDPRYVQVSIERWQTYTGKPAVLDAR